MSGPRAGIHGWGAYIPAYRLPMSEIARIWGWHPEQYKGLAVEEKAVAGPDEDSTTMGYEAARNAIARAQIKPSEIQSVFFGTESKPYAVKPSATIIAEALGITPYTMASDLEFACRAASEGMRALQGMVASGLIKYGLVIGSDTAQANPGDVLEFTAASGAAAFVIGPERGSAAIIEDSVTFVTDTPDFWRRAQEPYPLHGEGFTGEPAYFYHIENAVKALFERTGLRPNDFKYAIFHQPNGKFPVKVGTDLGFTMDQLKEGLVTPMIGNTYNASALLGLAKVLDKAKPGDRILLAPFGSGAGSDAYSIVVTDSIEERKALAPTVEQYLARKVVIDYGFYSKSRGIIFTIK
ncbi:putative hydroxymethylglutaryl-CoA synthase [Acidilobus saccharovorans 345-15]|uniref:Hydroxymethylglutaryl-CoA synthase n=1 Tax=Acidilobus saccharovorans (strain DSM 16705 / JCM 18335 / VKM B-2471 / 345-15) TaxID=666510 RepID=D9Q2A2_ACIS3|nr:hydroxymethylglutaryl-CoA synthase [Acidilobus saccharovorans]ADL19440.1 putative hydroxymethylglutaryl-CoA synthase [Acidilobus saccharovorans 345-15]